MSYRTYVTKDGTPWKVWEVTTSFAERRHAERRAGSPGGSFIADRRAGNDRRKLREVRAPARPGFEHGWLTFESSEETRRIGPVPPHWQAMSEAELEALRQRALAGPARRRRLIE